MRSGKMRSIYEVGNIDPWLVVDPLDPSSTEFVNSKYADNTERLFSDPIRQLYLQNDPSSKEFTSLLSKAFAAMLIKEELRRNKK